MINEVKKDILVFSIEMNLDVGHAFPARPFNTRVMNQYNPKQRDQILPAMDSLVQEHVFEARDNAHFLTDVGYQTLYPLGQKEVTEDVMKDILLFLSNSNALVGHAFPVRSYNSQRVINYNPPQKKVIDVALEALVNAGYLEQRGNGFFLTQAGFDHIY